MVHTDLGRARSDRLGEALTRGATDDEQRHRGRMEEPLGHRTEHDTPDRAVAVPAHHDELGVTELSDGHELVRRIPRGRVERPLHSPVTQHVEGSLARAGFELRFGLDPHLGTAR